MLKVVGRDGACCQLLLTKREKKMLERESKEKNVPHSFPYSPFPLSTPFPSPSSLPPLLRLPCAPTLGLYTYYCIKTGHCMKWKRERVRECDLCEEGKGHFIHLKKNGNGTIHTLTCLWYRSLALLQCVWRVYYSDVDCSRRIQP